MRPRFTAAVGACLLAALAGGVVFHELGTRSLAVDPGCIVAAWEGGKLTVGQVARMRVELQPPLSWGASVRLAADAAVVHAAGGKTSDSAVEALASYRQHVDQITARESEPGIVAAALNRLVKSARKSAKFRRGPCYVPLDAGSEGDVP